jgi:hypothetical protein
VEGKLCECKGNEGQSGGSEETNRIKENSVINIDPLKDHVLKAE